jgi:hypothetical protein
MDEALNAPAKQFGPELDDPQTGEDEQGYGWLVLGGCLGLATALALAALAIVALVWIGLARLPIGTDGDVQADLQEREQAEVSVVDGRVARVTLDKLANSVHAQYGTLRPAAGYRYWAALVTIEALGDEPVATGIWTVRTRSGAEYACTYLRPSIGPALPALGDVYPGEERRGWLVFEIPLGAQVEWLRYDPYAIWPGSIYFNADVNERLLLPSGILRKEGSHGFAGDR